MTLLQFLQVLKKEEKLKSITAACDFFIKKTSQKWTVETLRKVAYNRQKPSLLLAADIVYFSCGVVRMVDVRPDLLPLLKRIEIYNGMKRG